MSESNKTGSQETGGADENQNSHSKTLPSPNSQSKNPPLPDTSNNSPPSAISLTIQPPSPSAKNTEAPRALEVLASGDCGASGKPNYVLALDLGTTTLRAQIYDKAGHCKGSSVRQQRILVPERGYSEIDPEKLIEDVCALIHETVKAARLEMSQITCMGLTSMRASFITWDSETGKPFHNLISWQDLRATEYVGLWNRSYTLSALNKGSKILYTLVKKKRYLAASVLKFMSSQVTMKLLWAMDNVPELRKKANEGKALFGCIDTWVLWRLTGGKSHFTDYSCASSTGLYDPFQLEWSSIVCGLVNIPANMTFPTVKDTSGDFGTTSKSVLGCEIPITSIVADQQGSMFGQCCFEVGDIKCTLGTGTFIDLNTGNKPHASIAGLYPLIGWKIGKEIVFLAEGHSSDTGNVVDWAKKMGFFDDVQETSSIAESVSDSGGVYFVPAFSGMQAPFNDDKAVTTLFGLKPSTTKAHIVRSILEAISFRFKALYETILLETKLPLCNVRMDGGVARNDFVVQLMSDLVNQTIDRSLDEDMSCRGAAYLAGLAAGVWSSKEEIAKLRQQRKHFEPRRTWPQYKKIYNEWENAVHRSQNWYE